MHEPTELIRFGRSIVNARTDVDGYDPETQLNALRKVFDDLDRQLSFGAALPKQWDPHRSEAFTEDAIEYWRGR